MRLKCNRTICDVLHDNLVTDNPWGEVDGVSFIGKVVFDEGLGMDDENVSVYEFNVDCLVNDFIDCHIGEDKLVGDGKLKAEIIIADLKRMIFRLELVM